MDQQRFKVQITFNIPANDADDASAFAEGMVGLAQDVVAPFSGYNSEDISATVDEVSQE